MATHPRSRELALMTLIASAMLVASACSTASLPSGSTGTGTGGAAGGAPSGPLCTGTAAPCAGRLSLDCSPFYGCVPHGACSGEAAECGSVMSEPACTTQLGCAWNTSKSVCAGVPDACASFTEVLLCSTQGGCTWHDGACTGHPVRCDELSSRASCEEQPGCAWPAK